MQSKGISRGSVCESIGWLARALLALPSDCLEAGAARQTEDTTDHCGLSVTAADVLCMQLDAGQ